MSMTDTSETFLVRLIGCFLLPVVIFCVYISLSLIKIAQYLTSVGISGRKYNKTFVNCSKNPLFTKFQKHLAEELNLNTKHRRRVYILKHFCGTWFYKPLSCDPS